MRPVIDEITYGMYGVESDVSASSNTSPTKHFKLPPTGPWKFGSLSGTDLNKQLSNSNPNWYSNLQALGAQCQGQFLDVVEETGYLRHQSSSLLIGFTEKKKETMSSIAIPNYKKRSAAGEIFNNPFSRSLFEAKGAAVEIPWEKKKSLSTVSIIRDDKYGSKPYHVACSSFSISRTRSLLCVPHGFEDALIANLPLVDTGAQSAINSAYGNIQEGEVDLLVMAAEGRETLHHLLFTIQRFAALVSAIRRRDISKLCPKTYKKMKKGAFDGTGGLKTMFEDAWMEARYAWLPLVMDAVGVMNIITGNVTYRETFRAKNDNHEINDLDFTFVTGAGKMQFIGAATCIAGARAGVLTERLLDSPLAQQLGVFNIATVVKEVIPYSFVLEWFINLSGLLYSLNPNPMFRPLAAWCTEKRLTTYNGTLLWTPTGMSKQSIPISGKIDTKVRVPNKGPSILTIDVDIGIARFIDGAILSLRRLR